MSNKCLFANFAAMRERESCRERFKREYAEVRRLARQAYAQRLPFHPASHRDGMGWNAAPVAAFLRRSEQAQQPAPAIQGTRKSLIQGTAGNSSAVREIERERETVPA